MAPPRSVEAPDPFVGRTISDRFRITGLIARGGMGRVYRAEQAPLGRVCAVKVLNPNLAPGQDVEFHKRFFLEASTASKLTHPNTVTIFDYGRTDDDVYFMAMEYLEGRTLHRAIRQAGTMPEERAGHIARQICRALREAHSMGVIHRDLKPANIYLVEHGDEPDFVKVLDFGLVKDVSENRSEELTQAGLFMGSPKYMAPEQVRGDRVDARTDIYSLGVILYEMITGKVPFDRPTSVQILMAHVHDTPLPMGQANPQARYSPALEEAVMKCMAKDPDQRYRSMDEVLAALKRAARSSHTDAPAAHAPESARRVLAAAPSAPSGALPFAGTETGPTPMPVSPSVTSASPATGSSLLAWQQPPPAPSRRALATGVVAAIAVGAVVGYVAVRGEHAEPRAVAAPAVASIAAAAPIAPAASNLIVKVRISSDPDGATVKENGVVICMSTPCDVLYADADPDRAHEITLSLAGFRTETRAIKVGDSPVLVRLPAEP